MVPRAVSLATGGVIQASDLSSTVKAIGEEIAGATADIAHRTIEEAVKHHEDARDEVDRFRLILADCAEAIATREAGRVRRLIIFIDELDRCRPDYAVQVLECIKHFCSVPHVVFVVAIDRDTLNAAVQAVYGAISIDGYLRKFFDYHVELESPSDVP
jgi:predicted KAP-like P-loop ATPase